MSGTPAFLNISADQRNLAIANGEAGTACIPEAQSTEALSAKFSDVVLVLGNKNSSNSVRLAEISALTGIPTYRISDKNELNLELIKNCNVIGVTAGASTPEVLVKELVNHLKQNFGYNIDVEILDGEQEKVSFKLPELVK